MPEQTGATVIGRDHMDALRLALTDTFPDTIAVIALTGSQESGQLGMWTSSTLPEEETLRLLAFAITTHPGDPGWLEVPDV